MPRPTRTTTSWPGITLPSAERSTGVEVRVSGVCGCFASTAPTNEKTSVVSCSGMKNTITLFCICGIQLCVSLQVAWASLTVDQRKPRPSGGGQDSKTPFGNVRMRKLIFSLSRTVCCSCVGGVYDRQSVLLVFSRVRYVWNATAIAYRSVMADVVVGGFFQPENSGARARRETKYGTHPPHL